VWLLLSFRTNVNPLSLAQSLALQLGVKLSTGWIARMHQLMTSPTNQLPPRLLPHDLTPENRAILEDCIADDATLSALRPLNARTGQLEAPGELFAKYFGLDYAHSPWGTVDDGRGSHDVWSALASSERPPLDVGDIEEVMTLSVALLRRLKFASHCALVVEVRWL
jgi:hypothetical protein